MRQIRPLTGLRGWAALWVFFYHGTYGWVGDSIGLKIARQGHEGVVVFFVLSGFILSYVYAPQLASGELRFAAFIRARIARVYPLHLFVLLAFVVLTWVGLIEPPPWDGVHTFLLNLLLVQAWGFIDPISWNQPAWSISVEACAYLLFPMLLPHIMRLRPWMLLLYAAAIAWWLYVSPYMSVIAALVAHGLIEPVPATHVWHFIYGMVLWPFLAMFVAGVLLFRAVPRSTGPSWRRACDLAAMAGVGALAYMCLAPAPSYWLVTAASVLIVAGLYGSGPAGVLLFGNPLSMFLGEISYALYLSHDGAKAALDHLIGGSPLPLWLLLPAVLLLATTLHYGIERPARKFLRNLGETHAPLPAAHA